MIHYLPLEAMPQRYGPMMNEALAPYAGAVYVPKYQPASVTVGEFLDVTGTISFKAQQLDMVAEAFRKGEVKDGDVFLLADLYFPGMDAIKYMAELQGMKVYVAGFNYAGRSDVTDFLQRLGPWADAVEEGFHSVADAVFVGSHFHRANIERHFRRVPPGKLHVTGYVWDAQYPLKLAPTTHKEDFAIWPHRPSEEKGIDELAKYAKRTTKRVVITSCGPARPLPPMPGNVEYRHGLTKAQYYDLVARARWYLSTAHQETFGYTLQEAIVYQCAVQVPRRACYPEMVPAECLYDDIAEVDAAFDRGNCTPPLWRTKSWSGNAARIASICNSLSE